MDTSITHPLAAGSYSPDRSVLETHPEVAVPVSRDLDATWTGGWDLQPGTSDADQLVAAELALLANGFFARQA